jgi:hypothetical protein
MFTECCYVNKISLTYPPLNQLNIIHTIISHLF